jgi:hypothetical protein
MFEYTKEETVQAAKQFCFALDMWAFTFSGGYGAELDFETDETGCYILSKADDNRLSQSNFVTNISTIFNFAKTGSWNDQLIFESGYDLENELNEVLTRLSSFCEVFKYPDIFFHDYEGNDLINLETITILSDVLDMAFSRFTLITGGDITLEQLASLADVNLKTVRNALSLKGVNQLVLSTSTIKGKSCVEYREAMRWLEGKKGYSGPLFINELPQYSSYKNLGQLQHHCLSLIKHSGLEWNTLEQNPGWTTSVTDAFIKLNKLKIGESLSLITPSVLKIFGEASNVPDIALFVKESSKIVGATFSEFQAIQLFS